MMKRKNFVSHERLLKAMESTSEDARRLKDEYPYAVAAWIILGGKSGISMERATISCEPFVVAAYAPLSKSSSL